ncbi:MAG: hypothetical protein ACRD2C_23705 [Acidimicrobiales bacterium]
MGEKGSLGRRALLQGSAVASTATVIGVAGGMAAVFGEEVQTAAVVGEEVQTNATPATVQNVQDVLYRATNTSYGTAATEPGRYVHCQVVFNAPESGRVLIHWSGALRNLANTETTVAYLSPEVRAGGTAGSGTVVLPAHDGRTVRCNLVGVQTIRAGATHLLSGLTPGSTYNARLLHRVTSNTGEFFYRSLIAAPTS